MLIILPLFLLLLAPIGLVILHQRQVRYAYSWFLATGVCAVAWGAMLVARLRLPQAVILDSWEGVGLETPVLLLDSYSWPFALALIGVGLAVVLSSAQRLADAGVAFQTDWRNLSAVLGLLVAGLLGVLAGNSLMLLLAWAGIDLLALFILLRRVIAREASERIVVDFSARVGAVLLVVWATVVANGLETPLRFEAIPVEVSGYLLLACGLRLGILPLQVYFFEDLPLRRGLGTMVRMMAPAAGSLMLLTRVATVGVPEFFGGVLLVLTAFAGVYAGFNWLVAADEMEGRSFWVLGVGALAVASAVRGAPEATLAWGLALILGGGMVLLFTARSRWLTGLLLGEGLLLSGLVGLPAYEGTILFALKEDAWGLAFLPVYAMLLMGYVRHVWREGERGQDAVRAVRGAYVMGLGLLPVSHLLAGWLPGAGELARGVWWAAPVGVGLAAGIGVWIRHGGRVPLAGGHFFRRVFSFHWLYRLIWRLYRLLGAVVAFFTMLLEGEAGVLWTLILLFLLVTVIAQAGLGG